jgi:hypothetical protein
MPDHPKTFTEMLGEALREVAVLVIVFVLLDVLVSGRHFTWIWFWPQWESAHRSSSWEWRLRR